MACESDKCEKYGMHHDFVNGVEVRKCQFCMNDQPERSKREDSWRDRSMTNSQYEQFIKDTNEYMRCGALNSMET